MKPFNEVQKIALKVYDDGQHLVDVPEDVASCEDFLLQHILSELEDQECVEHREEAIRRLDMSIRQLQDVLCTLEDI